MSHTRNLGFRQRLNLQYLQQADYVPLRHVSRRAAWAIGLFWCAAVWTFIGLGIWAWLS